MEKRKKIAKVISIVLISIAVVMFVMAIGVIKISRNRGTKEEAKVVERVSQGKEETNEISSESNGEEQEKPKALDVSSWDTSKVSVYTDKSGRKAPIPVGYVASQVVGETEIATGLVIYEGTELVTGTSIGVPGTSAWTASCNRNQWVWVPVEDVNRIYYKSSRKSKLWSIMFMR